MHIQMGETNSSSMMSLSSNCGDSVLVHYLYPAALVVPAQAQLISTILGSCVAVCLWDSKLMIGGMNHFMLPLWNGQGLASPKYGNIAINKLIEKMESFGVDRKRMIAKVFGGAEVLENMSNHFNIGTRNIEIAMSVLEDYRIPVVGSHVGGKLGRKILMCTKSGEVRMKFVQKQNM